MRVLLTGAEGYLGRPLTDELRRAGHETDLIDAGLFRASALDEHAGMARTGDTRDLDASVFEGYDAVVHLAELSNDPLGELDSELTVDINHRGSVRLADLAAEAGVERLLYFSSCSVYGATGEQIVDETGPTNPLTTYARCKVAVEGELLGTDRGQLQPIIMRNATVYGPSPALRLDLAINEFVYDAVLGDGVHLRSAGTSWRPFVHCGDIAVAARTLLEAPLDVVGRQVVNIGSDDATITVRTAADIVAELTGAPVTVETDSPDLRDYRVSFAKLGQLVPELEMREIRQGISDLVNFVREHASEFRARPKEDFFRLVLLKRQMDAAELDATLRRTS